jgi:hypothetical protein
VVSQDRCQDAVSYYWTGGYCGSADFSALRPAAEKPGVPEVGNNPGLNQCFRWLRLGGVLWVGSIGWYNYMASHCLEHISIYWNQVFFSERALICW